MAGPAPKHPSVRNRRNKTGGFRQLPAVPAAEAPAWPLLPDAAHAAEREALRDRVSSAQQAVALAGERAGKGSTSTERSRLHRARKALERDQIALAMIEIQFEQAADAEAAIWADLWEAPQAAIWAENSASVREVALYARWMVRAEQGDAKAAAEARQLSDRLGINPAALLKLRAEIENVDAVEDRGRRRRARTTEDQKPAGGGSTDPRTGLFAV